MKRIVVLVATVGLLVTTAAVIRGRAATVRAMAAHCKQMCLPGSLTDRSEGPGSTSSCSAAESTERRDEACTAT
jgi:hypothetical protein